MLQVGEILGLRHGDASQCAPHDYTNSPWRFIWYSQARILDRHTGSDDGKLRETVETFKLPTLEIVCHIEFDFCGHPCTIR